MEQFTYSEQDILERIDEYALYCYYLGYQVEIGAANPAPEALRATLNTNSDLTPSFGVFERKYRLDYGSHEFLWKDQGTGIYGDIFDLVRYLHGIDRRQARLKVCADHGLGGDIISIPSLPTLSRKYADPADIYVKSKPFTKCDYAYWQQYNVSAEILALYNVTSISCYWLLKGAIKPSYPQGGIGYAYWMEGKYQLYFPYAPREYKFRSDWNDDILPGRAQLTGADTLIITKAHKDIMCLRSFGYEAVGVRGESTVLPDNILVWLRAKYQRILILFDNDMKHKGDEYPEPKIYTPGEKDVSDYCKSHGATATAEMLKQITYEIY